MHKGNKGDRHAGLHYQYVIEVSGNINANENIKSNSDIIKNGNYNTYTYTQVARITFCFFKSGPQTKQLGWPCSRLLVGYTGFPDISTVHIILSKLTFFWQFLKEKVKINVEFSYRIT